MPRREYPRLQRLICGETSSFLKRSWSVTKEERTAPGPTSARRIGKDCCGSVQQGPDQPLYALQC